MRSVRVPKAFRVGALVLLVALVAAGLHGTTVVFDEAIAEASVPNIVVVQVDDLDLESARTAVAQGLMPNFASWLQNSSKARIFDNAFVSESMCCPSRATFLTGQYAHNHGVKDNVHPDGGCAPLDGKPTLATRLDGAGYFTGVVGKWLNGYGCLYGGGGGCTDNPNPPEPTPLCWTYTNVPPGWNSFDLLVGNAHRMYNYAIYEGPPGTLVTPGTYQTSELNSRVGDFITIATEPSLLYVTPTAPHGEIASGDPGWRTCTTNDPYEQIASIRPETQEYDHLADEIPLPTPPNYDEPDNLDKPRFVEDIAQIGTQFKPCRTGVYRDRLESLKSVDNLIGALATALHNKAPGGGVVEGRTVVFFTSDNGFFNGEHRAYGKRLAYEESIRVPLVVRYPTATSARTITQFVLNTDLARTIVELAGITGCVGNPNDPCLGMDGQSLVPFLEGQTPAWRNRFLIEHWTGDSTIAPYNYPTFFGVRTANTNELYVDYEATPGPVYGPEKEYYDLDLDRPQETNAYGDGTCCGDLATRLAALKSCGTGTGQTLCQTVENAS